MYAVMYGERVRRLREEKGLSKRDLAAAAGISESTARNVEQEATVQGTTARKVARVFVVESSRIAHPAGRDSASSASCPQPGQGILTECPGPESSSWC